MASNSPISRRRLLGQGLLGAAVLPLVLTGTKIARAEQQQLVKPEDAAARKVKYTENAAAAKDVPPGNTCANCALYEGKYGSKQGPCQLFPDKLVVAAGWCSSWSPQM